MSALVIAASGTSTVGLVIEESLMGTWSTEPFGNDSANDWAYDLNDHQDFSLVAQAIRKILENETPYINADDAVEAIAAAEVLAKALGRGTQDDAFTEKVDTWLQSISIKPSSRLLSRAQGALTLILGPNSELRQLWEESDHFEEWVSTIKALRTALCS